MVVAVVEIMEVKVEMEVVDMEGAFSFVRQIFGKDLEFQSALS